MLACVDVNYKDLMATAALVLFDDWSCSDAANTIIHTTKCDADYEPGNFYKRELPCILAVLEKYRASISTATSASRATASLALRTIIIDGYVWLTDDGGKQKPGLGARLFDAFEEAVPIIGVAKTRFKGAPAVEILRGKSVQPLFVTAAGMAPAAAAENVRDMHGDYRLPTMIKLADQLCRTDRII
jgi:deoxyribonuclease V